MIYRVYIYLVSFHEEIFIRILKSAVFETDFVGYAEIEFDFEHLTVRD